MAHSYSHGTLSQYTAGRCRCDECRKAVRDYQREYRTRKPSAPVAIVRDGLFGDPRLPDRFWRKVDRGDSGCWIWTGARSVGYGRCTIASRVFITHRLAYQTLVGPVPNGLQLDHVCHSRDDACKGGESCRHRACVNPAHLEPVTQLENARRGVKARQTHCKYGHEFTLENTDIQANGTRSCRACKLPYLRAYNRRLRAAKRAAVRAERRAA